MQARLYAFVRKHADNVTVEKLGGKYMSGLALVMFVGLFAWGQQIVGYDDPHGRVQLALLATFSFGLMVGYRAQR